MSFRNVYIDSIYKGIYMHMCVYIYIYSPIYKTLIYIYYIYLCIYKIYIIF